MSLAMHPMYKTLYTLQLSDWSTLSMALIIGPTITYYIKFAEE